MMTRLYGAMPATGDVLGATVDSRIYSSTIYDTTNV